MTKPTTEPKTIEHREADATAISLPSFHIDHSAVFRAEIDNRLMGFDAGIAAIVAEMNGRQAEFERRQAEALMDHEREMGERRRLKADLERSRRMTLAAQKAYGDDIPADIEGDA